MSRKSTIEWTNSTWNPVTGCTKVSTGCDHCYAERLPERFRGVEGHPFESGFDSAPSPQTPRTTHAVQERALSAILSCQKKQVYYGINLFTRVHDFIVVLVIFIYRPVYIPCNLSKQFRDIIL